MIIERGSFEPESELEDSMIGRFLSELPLDHPERKSTSKPQLRRFIHHDKRIKYRGFLGEGLESCVYHINVEGESYALKLFKHWPFPGPNFLDELKEKERIMAAPFVHESRAFARLDSIGENGTWAVKCHGWIKLNDEQFKAIGKDRFTFGRWAIVKDLIREKLTMNDIPEIRRKMQIARKALLWPRDIKSENYRGSFVVDLGSTLTYPYIRRFWSKTRRREAFAVLDEDISEWEPSIWNGQLINKCYNEMRRENMRQSRENRERRAREDEARLEAQTPQASILITEDANSNTIEPQNDI